MEKINGIFISRNGALNNWPRNASLTNQNQVL